MFPNERDCLDLLKLCSVVAKVVYVGKYQYTALDLSPRLSLLITTIMSLASAAPKSVDTRLRGASIEKGWSISESINIPVVNTLSDTPGSYGGDVIKVINILCWMAAEFGKIFNRRKHVPMSTFSHRDSPSSNISIYPASKSKSEQTDQRRIFFLTLVSNDCKLGGCLHESAR